MRDLVIVNIDNAFNIVISIKLGQFDPCHFYKFKFLTLVLKLEYLIFMELKPNKIPPLRKNNGLSGLNSQWLF